MMLTEACHWLENTTVAAFLVYFLLCNLFHTKYAAVFLPAAVPSNRSTNSSSWKTKSYPSGAASESYTNDDEQRSEPMKYNKRALECSDSEIDENDDYASFRGKKQSKKKASIEANRARNLSPSGSEVTDYFTLHGLKCYLPLSALTLLVG